MQAIKPVTIAGNKIQIWGCSSRLAPIRELLKLKFIKITQIVVLSRSEKNKFPNDFSVPIEVAEKNFEQDAWEKRPGDLLISIGWHRIFSPAFIEKVPLIINIHPSLLPKYRGWALNWALVDGEKEHGLSAHIVDQGIDTGPILLQEKFELSVFDSYRSLLRKLLEAHNAFLPKLLKKLIQGELVPIPQDNAKATAPPRRTPKDSEIDPSKPLIENYNLIRASDPEVFPAFFYLNGQKINIKLWRSEKTPEEQDMI